MVKPMTIKANPAPTQAIELPLEIYNTAIDGPRTIHPAACRPFEDDQGTWQLVEPNSGVNLSGHASSLPWTTLSASSVNIGPQQPADIMVRLKPPANARGYYFAGIIAETPIPEHATGVVVRIRFLIPLIVEIKGRTVPERVALSDVAMNYRTGHRPAPDNHCGDEHHQQRQDLFPRARRSDRRTPERWPLAGCHALSGQGARDHSRRHAQAWRRSQAPAAVRDHIGCVPNCSSTVAASPPCKRRSILSATRTLQWPMTRRCC